MGIALKPLKKDAKAIGGLIAELLSEESDSLSWDEYRVKCATWLAILRIQKRNEGVNK